MRDRADSIGDHLPPDAIDKLYRLALSTVHGEFDPDEAPADFIYIAEEAGEAARRTGPKPLVEMAGSDDVSQVVFAARAITAFVDAVRHGESHGDRFDGKGDAKLYAEAKRVLREPCKRLATHDKSFVRGEGARCLTQIDPARPEHPHGLLHRPRNHRDSCGCRRSWLAGRGRRRLAREHRGLPSARPPDLQAELQGLIEETANTTATGTGRLELNRDRWPMPIVAIALMSTAAIYAMTLGTAVASDAGAPVDAGTHDHALGPEAITPWPAVLPCASPRTLLLPHAPKGGVRSTWTSRDGMSAVSFESKYADWWLHLGPRFPVGRLDRLAAGSDGPTLFCRRTAGDFPDEDVTAWPSIAWGPCGSGTCEVSATYAIPRRLTPWRTLRWTRPKRGFDWDDWKPPESAPRSLREIMPPGPGNAEQARRSSIELTRDIVRDLREALKLGCGQGRCTPRVWAADRALAAFLEAQPVSYEGRRPPWAKEGVVQQGAAWNVVGGGVQVAVACEDSSDGVMHQPICWEIAIDLGADKLRYEQREDRIVFEGPEGAIAFNWDKAVTISGAALSLREAR